MEMPRSCTLYLRHAESTPDFLQVTVYLPDARNTGERKSFVYETPVVKVQSYTKEEIFQKKLLAFLPYYILRYEKKFDAISQDEDGLRAFLSEWQEIQGYLERTLGDEERAEAYTNLVELVIKISDHLLALRPAIQKGVERIMGGNVLELRSERLLREGREEGREEGLEEGMEKGRRKMALAMLADGEPIEKVAKYANLSVEELKKLVQDRE